MESANDYICGSKPCIKFLRVYVYLFTYVAEKSTEPSKRNVMKASPEEEKERACYTQADNHHFLFETLIMRPKDKKIFTDKTALMKALTNTILSCLPK